MELEYPWVHDIVDVDAAAFDWRVHTQATEFVWHVLDLVEDDNMHEAVGIPVFHDWLEIDLVVEEIEQHDMHGQ